MTAADSSPVTVPEGEDPWAVLRTMQKFMPGTPRGECEIIGWRASDTKSLARGLDKVIGLTVLTGHPEKTALPVFDCRTRVVEVAELAAWLKARGYEASACQWNRPNGGQFSVAARGPAKTRWQLITGKAGFGAAYARSGASDPPNALPARPAETEFDICPTTPAPP